MSYKEQNQEEQEELVVENASPNAQIGNTQIPIDIITW